MTFIVRRREKGKGERENGRMGEWETGEWGMGITP